MRGLSGRVLWVPDGDTILVRLQKRQELVRYIGVNAPEIRHPTRRAFSHGRR